MMDAAALAAGISSKAAMSGKRTADLMFVLDCTHSMRGELSAMKDTIMEFADTIESAGVRVRVGLVAFYDRLHGEEHQLLTFAGEPFTSDPKVFRHEVSTLSTKSGYDVPESSLDALMLAIRQPFAPDANKVIILVTDAPPQVPDKETGSIEEVVEAMRDKGIQQVYLVMNTQDPESMIYLRLLEPARGVAFDLGSGDEFRARAEHFKRTLMALGKTISSAATS